MKTHRECLTFNIPARMDFLNITPQVEAAVAQSGVQDGLVLVNAMQICVQTGSCRISAE
jgi:thiamine phosphate synthase YjbQ (UPF0047 family)